MNTKGFTALSRCASKLRFAAKKHAPAILMVTGAVSVVTGTVVACKATLKAQEVLDSLKEERESIKQAAEAVEEGKTELTYTEEQKTKDTVAAYTRATMSMAKLYLPAAVLISTGIVAMFASNNMLKKRCASLSAAYATLDSIFKRYRKNVVDKYGEEVDKELRYGVQKKKIEVETIDPNTGKSKKTKKEVAIVDIDKSSDYARFFDCNSKYYYADEDGRPQNNSNMFFLTQREKEANYRLQRQGYLFLNDVYDMLGLEPSIAGQSVGWIYNPDDKTIDSYVSFNIFNGYRKNERFIEGIEEAILLDFNVDGDILTAIKDRHLLATK